MKHESTVYTSASEAEGRSAPTRCPQCKHQFDTGNLQGEIFCVACGHKFNYTQTEKSPTNSTSNAANPDPTSPPVPQPSSSFTTGRLSSFGDYKIIEEIARGGMGVVYKAQHKTLKRIVALKVLKSADGASDEDIKRFIQEAKAAAVLKHPNIVPIHNFDVYRGLHFFTMDFIDGQPLDRILETGPLPPYKACELLKTIAESIAYAHNQGIIHRDIKPGNVIIDKDGQPILTDFGLAVNLTTEADEGRMTKSGAIMGTLPYISPEQASGKLEQIGPLSDIYSLGALFYEMITGRPPFQGMTQFELLQQIVNHYPPSPRKQIPRLSKDIDTIILKCLFKEPARRYQSATELAEDCAAFLHGDIIKARPSSLFYKLQRKILRHPGLSILLGSLILISIFTLLVLNYAQDTIQQLLESQAQQAQISKDKDILGAMLKRDWRGEYSINMNQEAKLTTSLTASRKKRLGWYNPDFAQLNAEGLKLSPGTAQSPVAFGAPVSLPFNFHVNFKVYMPETNMGKVEIFSGLNSDYNTTENTRIIELGVEGAPGAKVLVDNTPLTENGSFTLNSGREHNISIFRDFQNGLIIIQVDNIEVIKLQTSNSSVDTTDSYIGVGANNGEFTLKSLQISVLGMNQEMIRSSLRLADSLAGESKDKEAAKVLYQKVLKERSDRPTLLLAYSGFVKTLTPNERSLIYDCNNLADSIRQSRSRLLEPGEVEYLTGIALAEKDNPKANTYFNQSFNYAYRNALKSITPVTLKFFLEQTPPEVINQKSLQVAAKLPEKGWSALPAQDYNKGIINLKHLKLDGFTTCYLQQSFELKYPTHIVIYLDDNADQLLINHKEFTDFLEDKGRGRRYALIDLPAGENTLTLKHKLNATPESKTIMFRVLEHNLKYTTVYGLLSRVESALLLLKSNPDLAVKQLTKLQNDNTLKYLKQYYPAELKSRGILYTLLNATDLMLKDPKSYANNAWILLEAARTLSDESNGSELAVRYNKLAESLVNSGELAQASDLFTQASTLLPDWPKPLLNRAKLLYRQEDLWYEGVSAFDDALKRLPNSLELRLDIAEFYLHPGNELLPNPAKKLESIPERALAVAREGVTLSNRKSPEALTLCAKALDMLGRKEESLHYIQEAILLESTDERQALQKRLNQAITQSN